MQNITNFIPSAVNALKHPERGSPTSQRPASIDRQSAEVINKVFVDLQASFPAWKQVWPNTDSLNSAKRIWTVAFIEAGISSVAQIQRGLKQCRHHGSAWPPAVGLFLKWCRAEQATPESLGLPTVEKAFKNAAEAAYKAASTGCNSGFAHPVILHAARETGYSELINLPAIRSLPLFERNYSIAVRMFMRGETLQEIPKALTHSKPVPPKNKPLGNAALNAIRSQSRRAV